MTASGALELAIALVKEHQHALGSTPQLFSVLDSELDQNHEIYDAALRRIEGAYVAVDRMTEPSVEGAVDATLKDLLVEALRLSPLGLEIEIEQHGAKVVVRRVDGIDPTNESERLILAFAAALFSQEFATRTVAAISWTEAPLELLAKETLWQLIRVHLAPRGLGSLRTLIFIAGGRVDPELHCEHEPSVRFALTERGLSKRKGPVSLSTAVAKLVRDSEHPFVLFLGAGTSASARMPLGDEVRDYALERFFGDAVPPPVNELAVRFHQWVTENDRLLALEEDLDAAAFVDRLTLERVLREEFRRDGREQSPTLQHLLEKNGNAIARTKTPVRTALRRIIERPHKLVIVTVNFDTILEDEFDDGLRVFAKPDEFGPAPGYIDTYLSSGGAVPLLKLHGTLAAPDSIVADVDTRSLGLPAGATEALQLLRGDRDHMRPWIYVGVSMRDPDITEVIGTSDFAERLDEWWVSPLPDPAVGVFADEHRSSRWQEAKRRALGERQITETADVFLNALAGAWPDRA